MSDHDPRDDRDDYLWDGGGAVDPDVARLEGARSPGCAIAARRRRCRRARPRRWPYAAAAAVVAAAAVAAVVVLGLLRRAPDPGPPPLACAAPAPAGGFRFEATAGAPRCGGDIVAAGWLPVGGAIETGRDDHVRVQVADIGQIELGGDSRLALVGTGAAEHRLALDRGRLHARVSAPPRLFVIDTPSATAVDLGCEYDLEVGPDGAGALRVTSGVVELEGHGRTVVVPMGAGAVTRPGAGPGTPWAIDAAPALRGALARLDRDPADPAALDEVLRLAVARDSVSLWNLLAVVAPAARGRIFDRLAALDTPPEWVLRDDVVAGDPTAIARLREYLEGTWLHPEVP
ncbi:MAG: FecR domain-containing protein [Kofleriaceae bacterium]|nr:FecR domain-containing protein [Kofleriaceae bacterium]